MVHNLNSLLEHQQPIIALSTPQGAGAIGLIRLSGDGVCSVIQPAVRLASGKTLAEVATHTIHYGWVVDQQGQRIDQVLFLVMRAPKTFTGQDSIEITCHNNPFLIESIIDRMIACGVRRAGKGEFTQRAVMLGKIDLLQAEAINDLIHAQTAASLKYSLQQLEGSLSAWIFEIETSVLEMMAFCEGSFEFLDEEMEFSADVAVRMNHLIAKIQKILNTYPKQQYIKEGVRVALVGSVNVGKSSLFNCLVEKNRAIVTPIAGTTRDTIECSVYRDGEFITFVDTAGIRTTDDQIEQAGIDRSFQEAHGADIVLLVIDCSVSLTDEIKKAYQDIVQKYGHKIIVVYNKVDQQQEHTFLNSNDIVAVSVSAKQQHNIDILFKAIVEKIITLKGTGSISCLLNQRQYDLLKNMLGNLQDIEPMLQHKRVDYELISYRLKEALQSISQLTGKSISEAALDKVFQTFCVGK